MGGDDDTDSVLAVLQREQRELIGEGDGLRRFLAGMRAFMDSVDRGERQAGVRRLLEQFLDSTLDAVNARDGSILVPDPRTRELVFVVVRGTAPHRELVGRRLPGGEGIAGWAATNRRAVIVNNVAADDRFYSGVDRELDYQTRSVLAAPLIGCGRLIGVVELVNKNDRRLFSVGNKTLLDRMCRIAGGLLASTTPPVDFSDTGTITGETCTSDAGTEPVS